MVRNAFEGALARTKSSFPSAAPLGTSQTCRWSRIQLVGNKALRAIERLQPYDGRMGLRRADGHPLVIVKEVADADKHRVLASSFVQIRFDEIRWEWDEWETGDGDFEQPETVLPRPLSDGVELTRIRFKQGNRKANARASRTPEADLLFSTDRGAIRHKHSPGLTLDSNGAELGLVGAALESRKPRRSGAFA